MRSRESFVPVVSVLYDDNRTAFPSVLLKFRNEIIKLLPISNIIDRRNFVRINFNCFEAVSFLHREFCSSLPSGVFTCL